MNKEPARFPILFGFGLFIIILAAPLAGVLLRGEPVAPFLQFPPQTMVPEDTAFSWLAFLGILLFIVITTWPFWKRMVRGKWTFTNDGQKFPWWGWLAVGGLICFWILAWTRFAWLAPLQRHTFFPLWFCFVITLNALAVKTTGGSLMTRHTGFFVLLFPISAFFWWLFEYLNRFVNNWVYSGITEAGGWQYFWEATPPFSTVLPAVMSLFYLVMQIPLFRKNFTNFPSMPWLISRPLWTSLGIFSIVGLAGTGWKPDYTFPLLWIAPGLLWIAFQMWRGYINPVLEDVSNGDFTLVWASAVSALICGFFWEMWNIFSEAKWTYNVPGIERFYLFEMPALGYSGYLPFGVICLLISYSLFSYLAPDKPMIDEQVGV